MIEYENLIQIFNFKYNFNINSLKKVDTNVLIKLFAFAYKNKNLLIKFDICNTEHINFRTKLMSKILIDNNQNLHLSGDNIKIIFYMIFHHNENYIEDNYNFKITNKLEKVLLSRGKYNFVNNVLYKYYSIHQ